MLRRALVPLLALAYPLASAEPLTDQQVHDIDRVFHQWDRDDAPGMAVGVIVDGEMVYERGFGLADLEHKLPITPESAFFIASISKQFTGTGILLLAEQGKLNLDDSPRTHIPEVPEYFEEVTIDDLLHHTSGVRDYYTLFNLAGDAQDDYRSDRETLEMIARQDGLNFEPGTEYLYSNSGYFLLKEIVERASGQDFRAFMQEQVFEPLGMENTAFKDGNDMVVPNRARAYWGSYEGGFGEVPSHDNVVGTRGIVTTIGDMLKWDRNRYDNKLGKGGPRLVNLLTEAAKLDNDHVLDYGRGISVYDYKGVARESHGGWFAGYRSQYTRFPDHNVSVLVFSNHLSVSPNGPANEVADIVMADHWRKEEEEKPEEPGWEDFDPEDWLDSVGVYRGERGDVREITLADQGLQLKQGGDMTLLKPTEDETWVAEDDYEKRFELSPAGVLTEHRENLPDLTYQRVPRAHYEEEDLERFVGRYYSRELDAYYDIVLEEENLKLRVQDRDDTLGTLPTGDFSFPLGTIRFTDTGLVVFTNRVREIEFRRVPKDQDTIGF
jgi:CubicO group peptidase (beta-lactamase class C family)